MNSNETAKMYNPVKIPDRQHKSSVEADENTQKNKAGKSVLVDKGMFYEIEYDSCQIEGVGKFVLKPQKIVSQEKDEVRELFYAMRDISKNHQSYYGYSRIFDKRVQQDIAFAFYKQGIFMKGFTDDYGDNFPLSSYYPNYHMMGYEQLRTYFTWRTNVRKGFVEDTSLSYAFIYIYELLNNIGVEDPADGLNKLMSFWNSFRDYSQTIDKYVLRWLKDYHIYYQLPHSFKEFAQENNLSEHYPKMAERDDHFSLFYAISKYDIKKSIFFTEENKKLITDCFNFLIKKIKQIFSENGLHFDNSIFTPTKRMSPWQPFRDALFYGWLKQADRRVIMSQNEIYVCRQNKWEFNTVITSESGRQLVAYIMKGMEAELRRLLKFKYKLSADISTVNHPVIQELNKLGLSLENIITSAVMEFYKEATKIVVRVDKGLLIKIRQEALSTQEKLIVEQEEERVVPTAQEIIEDEPDLITDEWENFRNTIGDIERQALIRLLSGEQEIKQFADQNGMMLEVLIDGINEKAMDCIGDGILDEDLAVFDDYMVKVKEMVG
ncbi:MAG: TerB N-terminal domain-containing protein [Oscillospiraceae bacterium]|nr:TerB N-terminal domain-containing protein [Oscillospiraceae bacterium]